MSTPGIPQSELGKKLYALMPEVYRNRDMPKRDLANYLDAFGGLLDLIQTRPRWHARTG